FVWVKPQMGIGNYWRVSHEFMLLGIRGGLQFRNHSFKSWASLDRKGHSAKPEEVRRMIEKTSPGAYLELFGRNLVEGWTVWGNQIDSNDFFPPRTVGANGEPKPADLFQLPMESST